MTQPCGDFVLAEPSKCLGCAATVRVRAQWSFTRHGADESIRMGQPFILSMCPQCGKIMVGDLREVRWRSMRPDEWHLLQNYPGIERFKERHDKIVERMIG